MSRDARAAQGAARAGSAQHNTKPSETSTNEGGELTCQSLSVQFQESQRATVALTSGGKIRSACRFECGIDRDHMRDQGCQKDQNNNPAIAIPLPPGVHHHETGDLVRRFDEVSPDGPKETNVDPK